MLPLLVRLFADAISSTNPRVIDDARARKLSSDLKRCTYYETCATYGLNVERVFQDGTYTPCGGRAPGPCLREWSLSARPHSGQLSIRPETVQQPVPCVPWVTFIMDRSLCTEHARHTHMHAHHFCFTVDAQSSFDPFKKKKKV